MGCFMAANVSNAKEKSSNANEDFLADDEESGDFEESAEEAPARIVVKDPSIRRKIEDRLERNRLRDELGIYDSSWGDI